MLSRIEFGSIDEIKKSNVNYSPMNRFLGKEKCNLDI